MAEKEKAADMDDSTLEVIRSQINRVENNQSELYSLDRKKQEMLSNIREDFTRTKERQATAQNDIMEIKKDIAELKKSNDNIQSDMTAVKQDVKGIKEDMVELKTIIKNKKWQPKDIAVVITAILSFAAAVTVALIKG